MGNIICFKFGYENSREKSESFFNVNMKISLCWNGIRQRLIMISIFVSSHKNTNRYSVFSPFNGNLTLKVVPSSELDSTHTLPPCRTAISLTRASPKPTPPICLLLDLSTRKKGWKMLSLYSSGISHPVSVIYSKTWLFSCCIETVTLPPVWLYLIAFSIRLNSSL